MKRAFFVFLMLLVVMTLIPAAPAKAASNAVVPIKCYGLEYVEKTKSIKVVTRSCNGWDLIIVPMPLGIAAPAINALPAVGKITLTVGKSAVTYVVYTTLQTMPVWMPVIDALRPEEVLGYDPDEMLSKSTRHNESGEVITDIRSLGRTDQKTGITNIKKSDKLTIVGAKGKDENYYIVFLYEKSDRLRFAGLKLGKTYSFKDKPNGAKPLEGNTGIYYLPSELSWSWAWDMGWRTHNGHGTQGPLMTVGEGWTNWEDTKAKWYTTTWKISEVWLPKV